MAITDYTSLKTALNTWMVRDFDDDQLSEFVDLAENSIRRHLTGYQREITTTLVADSAGVVALPSDFIGIRSVYFGTTPYKYSISGSNLTVNNGAGYTFDVTYYGLLPSLSDSNPTNWLLDRAKDIYFCFVKAQAREFLEEWDAAAGLEAKAKRDLDDLNLQNTVAQYSRAGMNLPVQAV